MVPVGGVGDGQLDSVVSAWFYTKPTLQLIICEVELLEVGQGAKLGRECTCT